MKTNKEWFEELEEPYKTQALQNSKVTKPVSSLLDALLWSFDWYYSPQRHPYWETLYNKLENENTNPSTYLLIRFRGDTFLCDLLVLTQNNFGVWEDTFIRLHIISYIISHMSKYPISIM